MPHESPVRFFQGCIYFVSDIGQGFMNRSYKVGTLSTDRFPVGVGPRSGLQKSCDNLSQIRFLSISNESLHAVSTSARLQISLSPQINLLTC